MEIKLKHGKATLVARDEVQASAILKNGFEFATKTDEENYKKLKAKRDK